MGHEQGQPTTIDYRGQGAPARGRMSLFRLAAWVAVVFGLIECLRVAMWGIVVLRLMFEMPPVDPFRNWGVWDAVSFGADVLGAVVLLAAAAAVLWRRTTWPHPLLAGLAFYMVTDVVRATVAFARSAAELADSTSRPDLVDWLQLVANPVGSARHLLLPLLLVLVLLRWDTAPEAPASAQDDATSAGPG